MKWLRSTPVTLFLLFAAVFAVPAFAYASFQFFFPSDPDMVYTKYGPLKVGWNKFSENDNFTEYLGKVQHFDEDALTVEILVLRSYHNPQTSIHENAKYVYSSALMRQSVNCRNRTVSVQDLMMFSKTLSKGNLVKDLYDLDWDLGEARPGSIDERKVATLCGFDS
ncbi:surface-adhesin E family protein [Polynucleobacter sp. MWH-UH2A]|uniref:surface-adhesin E family protein n=1 Tax=Polynucleobacter sp. MWH-UH2A TaxID=1855617 RepID=UPI001BFE001C|nr:surface-adhesin E family protein [Polynucleobacter sp. MWH-UH2A]QWD63376.1 hypothetical protein IC571_06655 [Polynucleobacter sp. MWH-UH2A]